MDGVDLHRFYAYQSTVSELEVHGAGADELERRIFRQGVPPKVVPPLLLITRFTISPSAHIDIVSYSPWQRVSVDEVDVRVDICTCRLASRYVPNVRGPLLGRPAVSPCNQKDCPDKSSIPFVLIL